MSLVRTVEMWTAETRRATGRECSDEEVAVSRAKTHAVVLTVTLAGKPSQWRDRSTTASLRAIH